jgi:glyoxylase-like metal-dependent hydrolase (beta-lactamase superfamily II)
MAALGRFGQMLWNVDGIRITRVVEHVMPFAVDFFAEATPKDVAAEPWLVPDFVDPHGRYLMSFHTFVIEAGGRCIVVDTCTGNSKDRPLIPEFDHQRRPFLADLAAAGFVPEAVDTVVCTHLHVDHVGWNTQRVGGRWIPTFPRARYLFGAADIDYWARSEDPLHASAFADSVQPVIDAGLVEPVAADTRLTADVHIRTSPGHTPGHLSVWIGDSCVITGDVLHHPIQCRHPDWTATGDADPDTARATRKELLAAAASTNALVLGTHFAATSAGRVLATEDGYRFAPETPS